MFYILYKTTNISNGKTYIGIHQATDLDDGYLGSGLAMKRAIKKYGKENFKREILEQCSSYDELIEREKTFVNESWISAEDNYNLKTGGNSHGLLSEESKKKISETLIRKYSSGELISPMKGKSRDLSTIHNIGSKLEDLFSEEKVLEIKNKMKLAKIDFVPWNKGKQGMQEAWNKGLKMGPMSEEGKKKRSETLKFLFQNKEHHLKGKSSWNKGIAGPPSPFKGTKQPQIECPHCNKMVSAGNAKRWHFENCKLK